MNTIAIDVRYALRGWRRRPAVPAAVILVLALGIGAVMSVLAIADHALFRPLPFKDPELLVRVYMTQEDVSQRASPWVSHFQAIGERARTFESMVAQRFVRRTLTGLGEPRMVNTNSVESGWLETLGVQPVLGRGFGEQEQRSGESAGVVLVSHRFWSRELGARLDAVGRVLVNLDSLPYIVIGVLPRGFHYPYEADFWLPVSLRHSEDTENWGLNIQARLAEGTTIEAASAELAAISDEIRAQSPDVIQDFHLAPFSTRDVLIGDEGSRVAAILLVVALLLLAAVGNVAVLMITRAREQSSELKMRSALGASRAQLMRLLVVESILLTLASSVLGLALAVIGSRLLAPLIPGRLGDLVTAAVDARWLGQGAVLALVSSLVVALAPALTVARSSTGTTVKGDRASTGDTAWIPSASTAIQVAISVMLLTWVGLASLDLRDRFRIDLGYEPENLWSLLIPLEEIAAAGASAQLSLMDRLLEQIGSIPGVLAAGGINIIPVAGSSHLATVEASGQTLAETERNVVNYRTVTKDLFRALELEVLNGRGPQASDFQGTARVAWVSETLARRLWPNDSAVGQFVRLSTPAGPSDGFSVLGVVADVWEQDPSLGTWYVPWPGRRLEETHILFRSSGPIELSAVRDRVWSVDRTLPVDRLVSAEQLQRSSLSQQSFATWLGASLALVAFCISVLGIYGSTSRILRERFREIGIRISVGGLPGAVLRDSLKGFYRFSAGGILAGMLVAVGGARALESRLGLGTAALPQCLLLAVLVMVTATVAATLIPALRAVVADPVASLRSEV